MKQRTEKKRQTIPLQIFKGHEKCVTTVAWTADGISCLSGALDGTVRVWNIQTGCCDRIICTQGGVKDLAVSPDGRFAVGTDKTGAPVWNIRTGECLRTFSNQLGDVSCVAWAPDGKLVIVGSVGEIRIWELSTGKCRTVITGLDNQLTSVAVSPDGRFVLSADQYDMLTLCEFTTGRRLWRVGNFDKWRLTLPDCGGEFCKHQDAGGSGPSSGGGGQYVAFGREGSVALAGNRDGTLLLWEIPSGKLLETLPAIQGEVLCVAICPDARRGLSGGRDGVLRLWDLTSHRCIREMAVQGAVITSVAVSPDGRYVLSGGSDKDVHLWKLPRPIRAT